MTSPAFSTGRRAGWLANHQLAALQAFAGALDGLRVGDTMSGEEAARLASPQWQTVRRLAARTLDAFVHEGGAAPERHPG